MMYIALMENILGMSSETYVLLGNYLYNVQAVYHRHRKQNKLGNYLLEN